MSALLNLFRKILTEEASRDTIYADISDDQILQMVDELYLSSKKALLNEKHEMVIYTLNSLIDFDLVFRKVISYQLAGGVADSEIITERMLNFAVLMQSYYNSFRTNLLVDIVNYLNDMYNHVLDLTRYDFGRAMIVYKYAGEVNAYYLNELRAYLRDRPDNYDVNTQKIFNECFRALNEVRVSSVNHLRKLFQSQLHTY
jgi:hypothetical protein